MQKTLALLSLFALAFAQLPIFGSSNTTSSFGVSTRIQIATVTTVAGQVTSSSASALNVGQLLNLGINAQIFVSAQAVGNVNLFANSYVGGGINSLAGLSSSGGVGGAASVGLQSNFGFTVETDLTPGTFTVSLILTPSASLGVLTTLSSNLQLFYSVNATTGPYSASSNGAADGSFFGAVPSTITYNGNTVTSYNFTLPSVARAVLVAANVDLSVGVAASTPAVFPVLFGTVAKVKANAQTAYYFSKNFLIQLSNSVDTTIQATVNTTYNTNIQIATNTSANIGAGNTVYAGVAIDVSVQNQANLGATLVQNTSNLAIKAGNRVYWAFYNATTEAAQVLTNSVYDAASATVSVQVNHFSTYAVYSTDASSPATTSTFTPASSSDLNPSSKPNSAAGLFVSGLLVVAALLL